MRYWDALGRFAELAEVWDEVTDVLAVASEQGPPLGFVCLDERLLDAAEREGLRPVP